MVYKPPFVKYAVSAPGAVPATLSRPRIMWTRWPTSTRKKQGNAMWQP